jgi:plasmid maintenance system antidote protein VapI
MQYHPLVGARHRKSEGRLVYNDDAVRARGAGACKAFLHTNPQGRRVTGWEGISVTLLAEEVGVTFRYLIEILQGRRRNCTLQILDRTATALGMTVPNLMRRIERAHELWLAELPAKEYSRFLRHRHRHVHQKLLNNAM